MAQPNSKLVAALLGLVLLLQFWVLRRQSDLEQRLESLSAMQHNMEQELQSGIRSFEGSLRQMAEAQGVIAVQRADVEPSPSCASALARIEWGLREWSAGTRSRLLYRLDPNQVWLEAEVQSTGGASYATTFAVPVKPVLRVGVAVDYPRSSPGSEGYDSKVDKALFDQSVEYQIVAEGPSLSQSSGVKAIPLAGHFVVPAKINVRIQSKGHYFVHLYTDTEGTNRCARVESAEVRGYVGTERKVTMPLVANLPPYMLNAELRSEVGLTKLEIVIRHGGGEETVSIPLSGQ